ncbi:MAG: dTDP-4-dehydrorhamnose reductase, partial [Pseudomonadales bacterium]
MTRWGERKKIFLLGDKGQLGTQVKFAAEGEHIDISSHYALDLTDHDMIDRVLEEVCPDVVINCAAYTAVDKAEREQEIAFAVNAEAVQRLASWCAANERHLVHISTDYVFSGSKPLYEPYTEADAPFPVSIYGQSKLLGEENIKNEDFELYSILRTAWLYGANGNNFLKTMLRLVLGSPEREYKVVSDQFGSPTSADAMVRQIKSIVANEAYGTFHAASHGYCSWYELACEFFAQLGLEHNLVPCTTQEYPTLAARPANSILDNVRLRSINLDLFVDWRDDL